MVITACLVVSVPDATHATTKSTMCFVEHSSSLVLWQRGNHTHYVLVVANNPKRDANSLVTGSLFGLGCHLPEHVCRISRSGEQHTCWFSGRSDSVVESSEIRRHHYRRRLHSSGNRDFGNLG